MRHTYWIAASILALAARLVAAEPPSVLLVTFDTVRADHVGCYGNGQAETPNLDRLASEGVLFYEARSHVPLTLPSHATILTGQLPPRHGARGNGLFRLDPSVPTLAEALHSKGYRTVAIVSSVVLDRVAGLDRGFDVYDDNQRVGPKRVFNWVERGASQVVDAVERELPKLRPPFFLWVHFYDAHTPYIPPDAYVKRHPGRPYDGEIAFADGAFGVVRESVSRLAGPSGLIVVATSDHGESLGEHGENQHGYTLHRGVLRVPLIVAGPGLPKNRVITETVTLSDLAPTLADLTGAKLAGTDGASLRPFWAEAEPPHGRERVWEETLHPLYDSGWAPLRGLLTPDWHVVEAPRPELYDARADSRDATDLSAAKPQELARLRAALKREAERLGDVVEPRGNQPDDPAARENRARLASLGYLAGAAGGSRTGPRLDPKDGLPGWIAHEQASDLLRDGKAKAARATIEPFTKKDPGNPRLWHMLGRALDAEGDAEGADRAFRRAIAIDGESEYLRSTYAGFLELQGRDAEATAQHREILKRNPRAIESTLALLRPALERKDGAEVDRLLTASEAAGVRDPLLFDALGYRAKEKSNWSAARRHFEAARDLDPSDATARLELGRSHLREGQVKEAFAELETCLESVRAFECRMEMARGFLVGPKDKETARELIQLALEVARSEADRREAQARLDELKREQP